MLKCLKERQGVNDDLFTPCFMLEGKTFNGFKRGKSGFIVSRIGHVKKKPYLRTRL